MSRFFQMSFLVCVTGFGVQAQILSAFHGVARVAVPGGGPDIRCPGVLGLSAMPLVLSREVVQASLQKSDFQIRLQNGTTVAPDCVTLHPAGEEDEDRTVLMFGPFGESANRPVEVQIVGSLRGEDGSELQGSRSPVIPLEDGPRIVHVERSSPLNCPSEARATSIRVIWTGGITVQGEELNEEDWKNYTVGIRTGSGAIVTAGPQAISDLDDGDNNHELCFSTAGQVVWVHMPASVVTDPNGDFNPEVFFSVSQE